MIVSPSSAVAVLAAGLAGCRERGAGHGHRVTGETGDGLVADGAGCGRPAGAGAAAGSGWRAAVARAAMAPRMEMAPAAASAGARPLVMAWGEVKPPARAKIAEATATPKGAPICRNEALTAEAMPRSAGGTAPTTALAAVPKTRLIPVP